MRRFGGKKRLWKQAAAKVACQMQKEMIVAAQKHRVRPKKKGKQSYMSKWYNTECVRARREIAELVKAGLKHTEEHKKARRKLARLARTRRRAHKKHADEQQLDRLKSNTRSFWSVTKAKKQSLQISDKAVWLQYGQMLCSSVEAHHLQPDNLRQHDGKDYLTATLVDKAINKLSNGKACDENGLIAELLKIIAGKTMINVMVRLFNKIALEGKLPKSWG